MYCYEAAVFHVYSLSFPIGDFISYRGIYRFHGSIMVSSDTIPRHLFETRSIYSRFFFHLVSRILEDICPFVILAPSQRGVYRTFLSARGTFLFDAWFDQTTYKYKVRCNCFAFPWSNFLNGNVWIPVKISLKFVRKGPIINNRKCQDYVYIKWEYWSTM